MSKAQDLLTEAKRLAETAPTWADLSNALFSPHTGVVSKAFATKAERATFMKTAEYKAIRALIREAMRRTGVIEGATPRKSGKFVVRLPSSLHESLEREAQDEGVSLNQLVVYKLSSPVKTAAKSKTGRSRWKSS